MTTPSPHPNPDPYPNQKSTVPVPDPTVLTTEQMLRAVAGLRDYTDAQFDVLRERLRGIDHATSLLGDTVNRVPTDVQLRVEHAQQLIDAKFDAVAQQFRERDTRSERESRDNKVAVDAAFAAQKEAAAKQDESNQKAIDKSERATTETIRTNANLFQTTTDALKERVASLELAIQALQSVKQGGKETISGVYALVGLIATLLVIGGVIATVLATRP